MINANTAIIKIVLQYGKVLGVRNELHLFSQRAKAMPEPKMDYYCVMFPDEHGEDYDFYRQEGAKAEIDLIWKVLNAHKVKEEKFFKRMVHEFNETYDQIECEELQSQIDIARELHIEQIKSNMKRESDIRKVVANLIRIILSTTRDNKEHIFRSDYTEEEASFIHMLQRVMSTQKINAKGNHVKASKLVYDEVIEPRFETYIKLIETISYSIQDVAMKYTINTENGKITPYKHMSESVEQLINQLTDIKNKKIFE